MKIYVLLTILNSLKLIWNCRNNDFTENLGVAIEEFYAALNLV